MVTASHNPPADNGYKVYLGDGAQIVPPVDGEIAADIDARRRRWPTSPLRRPMRDRPSLDDARRRLPRRRSPRSGVVPGAPPRLRVVYTADARRGRARSLAGVRRAPASPRRTWWPSRPSPTPTSRRSRSRTRRSPARWTWRWPWPRPSAPTWSWPTTPTPTGSRSPSPTAPRRRVAACSRGDEVGVLLADHLLRHGTRAPTDVVVTTVVSSRCWRSSPRPTACTYVETLTGFKWVARAAGRPEQRFVFGYEEALGYASATLVRDKDGISAAVVVAELVGALLAAGSSVVERLDELAPATASTHTGSVRPVRGPGRARAHGGTRGPAPRRAAGRARRRRRSPGRGPGRRAAGLPPSDVLVLRGAGARGGRPPARHRAQAQGLRRGRRGCRPGGRRHRRRPDACRPSVATSVLAALELRGSPDRRLASTRSGGAEEAVAGVAEARHDVGLVVEALVDRSHHQSGRPARRRRGGRCPRARRGRRPR